MMDKSLKESIKSFLSNLGNKDYSNANKDFERKLQERINKAYKKDLF